MRRPLVVGVCVLALAACGSSGGSKGGASPTRSTVPARPAAAAARLADAARIRSTDLPGWESTPRTGPAAQDLKDLGEGDPACDALVAGLHDGRPHVRSPNFSRQNTTAGVNVDVYPVPAQVQAQLELYRDPSIVGCLQSVFRRTLAASAGTGTTIGTVSVSPIAVDDAGFGFRITAEVTSDGTPLTVLTDIVGIAIGRVGVSLIVTSTDAADLAQTETTLLPVLAQRVRDAAR